MGSTILDSKPNGILVQWDCPMGMTCDVKDQISVIIDGASPVHPVAVEFNPTDPSQMVLRMGTPFTASQVVTWAYDDQGPCDLQGLTVPHTEADNQTYGVTNLIGNIAHIIDASDSIVDGTDRIVD